MNIAIKILISLILIQTQIAYAGGGVVAPKPAPSPATQAVPAVAPGPIPYPEIIESPEYVQARAIVKAAKQTLPSNLNTPADEYAFEQLVHAYATVKIIDDYSKFMKWFEKTKPIYLSLAPSMGLRSLADFLDRAVLSYQSQTKTPEQYRSWLQSVVANPVVQIISSTLYASAKYILSGVGLGTIMIIANSGLDPLVGPVKQLAAVVGVKYLGGIGKRENALFFKENKNKLEQDQTRLQEIRTMLANPKHFNLSADALAKLMEELSAIWNDMNHVYSQRAEAFRSGRSLVADIAIFRPADFSIRVTTSMNAVSTSNSSAWMELHSLEQRGANYNQVEQLGEELKAAAADAFDADRRDNAEALREANSRISYIQNQLKSLKATNRQVREITESFKQVAVYRLQTAGIMASKIFHDANYSDITSVVQKISKNLQDTYAIRYFETDLAGEVARVANTIDVGLTTTIKALELAQHGTRVEKRSALDVAGEEVRSTVGRNVVHGEGGLDEAHKESALEKLHEGADRAVHR